MMKHWMDVQCRKIEGIGQVSILDTGCSGLNFRKAVLGESLAPFRNQTVMVPKRSTLAARIKTDDIVRTQRPDKVLYFCRLALLLLIVGVRLVEGLAAYPAPFRSRSVLEREACF